MPVGKVGARCSLMVVRAPLFEYKNGQMRRYCTVTGLRRMLGLGDWTSGQIRAFGKKNLGCERGLRL